jgi:hypothetical protein
LDKGITLRKYKSALEFSLLETLSFTNLIKKMVEASIPRYYTLEEKENITPYYRVRNDYKKYQSNNTPIVIDNGKNLQELKLCSFNLQLVQVPINVGLAGHQKRILHVNNSIAR